MVPHRRPDAERRTRAFSILSTASATPFAGRARTSPHPKSPKRSAHFRESKRPMFTAWTIPGADGRAGMAALVADGWPGSGSASRPLAGRLPAYARPLFLRIRNRGRSDGTFKYTKIRPRAPGIRSRRDKRPDLLQRPRQRRRSSGSTRLYTTAFSAGQSQREARCLTELRSAVAKLECEIAKGPIVPKVALEEIRNHLARYDFAQPVATGRSLCRCRTNVANLAGAGYSPALFRPFQSQRHAGFRRCRHAGGDVQPASSPPGGLRRQRTRSNGTHLLGSLGKFGFPSRCCRELHQRGRRSESIGGHRGSDPRRSPNTASTDFGTWRAANHLL